MMKLILHIFILLLLVMNGPSWSQDGRDAYIAHTEKLVKALEGAAPFIENEIANIIAVYKSLQK